MHFGKLYPRMYLGVTAGLIDGRHHERLGAAWMLFLWCCLRQTGQGEEGIVCRGAVVTYAEIAAEMNCKRGSVREWMARLVEQGYVRTERGSHGIRIFILNPKKIRVPKVQHSEPIVSAGSPAIRVLEVQQSEPTHAVENTATSENLLQNNPTKLRKNNNTNADTNCASVVFSLNELAKSKSIPQEKTSFEIDARKRKLLTQLEEIKRKEASA